MGDFSEMRKDLVDTIRIELPWPDMALSPNRKHGKHWTVSHAAKLNARDSALAIVKGMRLPKLEHSELEVVHHFYPPDNRSRDDDNVIGAFKAQRDGVALGLRIDDKHWRSQYCFHKNVVKGGLVVLEITGIG